MKPYILNTGAKIPPIGFGTWQIKPDQAAKEAVLGALEAGYRLIDTARVYGNERGVGEAIRESGIPREEIFVTTKLWNDDQGYDKTLQACRSSLEKLGLDYLDLYLIHWPATSKRYDSWRAFEKLVEEGLIKAAGVSNFTIEHLKQLAERSKLTPAVNQVEFHPFIYEQQRDLLEYCHDHDILIEAYSPLSRLRGTAVKDFDDVAHAHHKSVQQIVLRWCLQQGTLPLPRSTNPDHIRSNFDIFDFELTSDDMRVLDAVSDGERVTWDPAGMG